MRGFGFGGRSGGGQPPRAKVMTQIVPTSSGTVFTMPKFGLLTPVTFAKTSGNANLSLNASTGAIAAATAIAEGASQLIGGTATGADGCVIPFSFTLMGRVVVDVPAAPSVTLNASNASVSIAWVEGANNGSSITQHKVYRGTSPGNLVLVGTITGSSPYLDTGLTNDTTYYYQLTAINSTGESQRSEVASVTPVAIQPEIWLMWGDSLGVGIYEREAQDVDWPNVYQYRHTHTNFGALGITSDTSPLDQLIDTQINGPHNYLSPFEYFGKQRAANIGAPVFLFAYNYNGSRIVAGQWGVGQPHQTSFITKANSAIAAIKQVYPSAKVGGVVQMEVSNGIQAGDSAYTPYVTACPLAIADIRSSIKENGDLGGPDISSKPYIVQSPIPEYISLTDRPKWHHLMRKIAAEIPNGKYYGIPENRHGDQLHYSNAGARLSGPEMANLLDDVTAPVIGSATPPSAISHYAGQKLRWPITADEYAYFWLTGSDEASLEVGYDTSGGNGLNLSRLKYHLRFAGDVVASGGPYNVTLNDKDANGNVSTKPITITVPAAYGAQPATIMPSLAFHGRAIDTVSDGFGMAQVPNVTLKAGMNIIYLTKGTGVSNSITDVRFNGLVATKDANSIDGAGPWIFYLPVAMDQTGTLLTNGYNSGQLNVDVFNVAGTLAAPSSSSILSHADRQNGHTTGTLTCPAGGKILCLGQWRDIKTPTAGITTVTNANNVFVGYRTTDGPFSYTDGWSYDSMAAIAFAPAV